MDESTKTPRRLSLGRDILFSAGNRIACFGRLQLMPALAGVRPIPAGLRLAAEVEAA